MITRILSLMFLFAGFVEASDPFGGRVTTRLQVVDLSGNPLEGMAVGISYPDYTGNRYDSTDGMTDERGIFEYKGQAYKRVYYSVRQEGYYFTSGESLVYEVVDRDPRMLDLLELRVVAKEIRDPIVMVATRDFRPILPGPDERVGFDFFVNDLVEPYGEGRRADVYFLLEGEFQDRLNHDSALTVEFAGEGDGLIPFEMDYNSGSILESGHEAPETGYERVKRTRKSIWTRKGLRPKQPGYVEYERANEVRGDVGYYIRIRTELDEDGNVISAYYGKIYGDFDFYGARPGGSFVTAAAYYLNPTPNDRNVEAVPGETLLEGVSRLDLPNRP